MTSPIDPIRRTQGAGRSRASRDAGRAESDANLPVPVGKPEDVAPPPPAGGRAAAFDAHVMGQDGQRRGLRAGPPLISSANALYNQTEWSGPADRRAPKGRHAKTKI